MASSSVRTPSVPRPTVKRASQTWPGVATSRNHFEDFLREIGANTESAFLCCVPRTTGQPHVHAHTHKRSTSNVRSKARSSSRANDNVGTSPQDTNGLGLPTRLQRRPESRERTPSSPKVSGNLTSGLPIVLKSPALSAIDLENHDAAGNYSYFSSARDTLLTVMSDIPVDERPSRAPTRTPRGHPSPDAASRSPPPPATAAPTQASPRAIANARTRPAEHRSRTRSSGRSSSRTPSIDSVDTASSSEAPATPRSHELPASLEELERTSRFRVQGVCTTCKRAGSNFPSCAKCGEMWCSRECRTGAMHACRGGGRGRLDRA